MTCEQCKYFKPYPHKDFDGVCRFDPHFEWRKKGSWCGKYKNKDAVRKTRKVKSLESLWSDKFKEFMAVFPCYREPDKAWKVWDDLCLELHANHIIKQAREYKKLVESEGREARYIKSNTNWLKEGGWKTHYDEQKANPKDCVDCGKPYELGHKYTGSGKNKVYRCEECRKK